MVNILHTYHHIEICNTYGRRDRPRFWYSGKASHDRRNTCAVRDLHGEKASSIICTMSFSSAFLDIHHPNLESPRPQPESPCIEYVSLGIPEHYEGNLGIALSILRDGRIRLAFDLPWFSKYAEYTWRGINLKEPKEVDLQALVQSKIEKLAIFYKGMRKYVDFCILDCDPYRPEDGPILYRLRASYAHMYWTRDKRENIDKYTLEG